MPDIPCRVGIGRGSDTAPDTEKVVTVWPVRFVDQAAARALPTGVARIDHHYGDAPQRRLVFDQCAQFSKAPVRHPRPLEPFDLDPIPDPPKVLKGDQTSAAFGICDDGFTQDMVCVALKPRLLAGSAPERTFRGAGANLLQCSPPGMLTTTHIVDLSARVGFPGVIGGKMDDTHVNPERIVRTDQRSIFSVTGGGDHPLATHEQQVHLALCSLQQFALSVPAGEWNTLASGERPDGDGILSRQKPENALVIRLCRASVECASRSETTSFQAVGNLGDTSSYTLRSKTEAGAQIVIGELVQIVFPSGACTVRERSKPIAGGIASFQCVEQECGLFGCGKQADGCNQLHAAIDTGLSLLSSSGSRADFPRMVS